MSNPKSPFELMMEHAQAMARAFPTMDAFSLKEFEKMWPTMPREWMETVWGNKVNENGLDAKTRLMLTLAGLTMQGAQNELALRQTVRHLSELDAKNQQIYEAIGTMSMFAGLPAAQRAMEIARDVLEDGKDEE